MILRYSRNSGASISIGIDFWAAFFLGGMRIVSADENDKLVDDFRTKYPQTPVSLRIDKPETALPAWLGALGVGENAPIPVHVLVDPADKVRCVRAGQVKESDLPAVRSILKSS